MYTFTHAHLAKQQWRHFPLISTAKDLFQSMLPPYKPLLVTMCIKNTSLLIKKYKIQVDDKLHPGSNYREFTTFVSTAQCACANKQKHHLGVSLVEAGGSVRMFVVVHHVEQVRVLAIERGQAPSRQRHLVIDREVRQGPVLGEGKARLPFWWALVRFFARLR